MCAFGGGFADRPVSVSAIQKLSIEGMLGDAININKFPIVLSLCARELWGSVSARLPAKCAPRPSKNERTHYAKNTLYQEVPPRAGPWANYGRGRR